MFGFFNRNKGPFTATIMPSGKSLVVKAGSTENLLKAALESGLPWPHSCRVGSCGTCKCKLLSGKIKPLNDFSYVLTGEELDAGYILACQTSLRSDVSVEMPLEDSAAALARSRTVSGRIAHVEQLTHDILDVRIALESEFSDYLSGQYADFKVPGVIEQARSYSFANSPNKEAGDTVSFFIRRVPNGQLTEWLYSGDRLGERVVLHGPLGSFYFRKPQGPIVLVAGGSGLAPIRAILQQIVEQGVTQDVTLIFGARTQRDLYCQNDIVELSRKAKGKLRFIPVLSSEPKDSDWAGDIGLCTEKIAGYMIDSSKSHAYICGPPVMVDSAVDRLKALGLSENRIFFDKFLDASTIPGNRLAPAPVEL